MYTDTTFLAIIIEISSNNSIHSSLIHLMSNIFRMNALHASPHQMRPTYGRICDIFIFISQCHFFQYWLIDGSVGGDWV